MGRCFRLTGRSRYIYNEIDHYNYTLKVDYTIQFDYQPTVDL